MEQKKERGDALLEIAPETINGAELSLKNCAFIPIKKIKEGKERES